MTEDDTPEALEARCWALRERVERAESERDKALAALEKVEAAAAELNTYATLLADGKMTGCEFHRRDHEVSRQWGQGWLSPEKAKELEDRIRQLEFDHDQWFVSRETCVELRKQVKLLVEALESIKNDRSSYWCYFAADTLAAAKQP